MPGLANLRPSWEESSQLPRCSPPQVLGESTNAAAVAAMIGERVYVKWPYLQEAKVREAHTARGARAVESVGVCSRAGALFAGCVPWI